MTDDEFRRLLESPEDSRIEFEAASGGFHFEDLVKYCVALANEGGGKMILGVTDKRPRQIVGTDAFSEPGRTEAGLLQRLRHQIRLEEHEQSKPLPDFSHTSEYSVWVTLHGQVQDPGFLRFLEEVGRERTASFATEDLLVLDLVHREEPVPPILKARVQGLLEQGVIERIGRGRGVRYLLSRRFYRFLGRSGAYTRVRGLDRATNKELILQHIQGSADTGTTLSELQQVLPGLSRSHVQTLLRELKKEGRVAVRGVTRGARWYPVFPKRNTTQ